MGLIMAETLGFSGNGDPCNLVGIWERTKGVYPKPRRGIPMSAVKDYPTQSQFLAVMGFQSPGSYLERSSNQYGK